jgi:molecular chaperone Hsp33
MSELHKFVFEGLPVRGMVVRLTDVWQEILRRRANNVQSGAYPAPVRRLLGEMTAAAALMQSNIKFNGALVLQIMGEGPVKLAVVEVQADLSLRATATLRGDVADDASLSQMVNPNNEARCAITLDPKDKLPGQQAYQGVVPLFDDQRQPLERFSDVLAHYMLQSEQLDTTLVLAANDEVAAGLLIQRLPVQGLGNLSAHSRAADEDEIGRNEDYARIAMLNALAAVKGVLGSLDRVTQIVKVTGFVASVPEFTGQPGIINGASELLGEAFGAEGAHARSALGVSVLPLDSPVEIEVIVAFE